MSHTPGGGHPQGWENKLADRSSLPPVPGEERGRPLTLYPEVTGSTNFHRYHGARGSSGRKNANVTGSGDAPSGGRSSPAYLRWARNLRDLLEDAEGVCLFRKYVQEAGPPHVDRLNFYFACQGLKQNKDPTLLKSIIAAIYRLLKRSELTIPEDVRRRIKIGLRDEGSLDAEIFDSMQIEVEKLIKETTYVSFLRSDTYLQHAQSAHSTSTHSSGSLSSSSSSKELCGSVLPSTLATLHEGEELSIQNQLMPNTSRMPQRLTKDLLMATQKRRLQPETFTGGVRNYSVYSHPHLSYSAYCTTSRQDSELQSMSSGRTDSDAMSMSGSSVDGISMCRSGHGTTREHIRHRAIMESAAMNKTTRTHDMVIPRTFRLQKGQCTAMKPDVFATLLIEKLEKVKRDQENQEKLDRKLMENNDDGPVQSVHPRNLTCNLAAALREKLQVDDDNNDQDILDQHVSRVWSDLTPARSPGRPTSPPHPHGHNRRCRDHHSTLSAQSALSADSGNVRDFGDASSSERTSNMCVSKSRSVPDYNDPFLRQSIGRRSSSRKTLTDLTDSGVSVVSDNLPLHSSALPSSHQPHSRILMWIQEGANSNIDRYGRKSFSRSGSAERPGQPVATDPQMPPLPSPHTPTQLDEARRRLLLDHHQLPSGGSSAPNARHSKRSGQTSGKVAPVPQHTDILSTVVMFTFLDEPVPYRTKIPAAPVTLKQFKEFLPKKGNYRYFFKTECEELENTPIQEEIFNDTDFLPLWEGKVMAKVKNFE